MTTNCDGRCNIDQVEAGELSVVALSRIVPDLVVKYALSNSRTGQRFGAGTSTGRWSDRTIAILKDLIASVEADIARDVFGDGTTTRSVESEPTTTGGVPSL